MHNLSRDLDKYMNARTEGAEDEAFSVVPEQTRVSAPRYQVSGPGENTEEPEILHVSRLAFFAASRRFSSQYGSDNPPVTT